MNIKSKKRVAPQPKTLIYAKCQRTRYGIGARIQDIFMSTYTPVQWSKGPVCPNCGGAMVKLYEGKVA